MNEDVVSVYKVMFWVLDEWIQRVVTRSIMDSLIRKVND